MSLDPATKTALTELAARYPKAHISAFENKYARIADDVFICDGVVLNGDIEISSGANLWYGAILRGDVNYIKVGHDVNIQDGTVVHTATKGPPTLIGNHVSIGHMALIHACELQDHSFVGMKAMIMDAAVVEEGAMVAAGAMVPPGKVVPSGWLWTGWPGKPLRELTDKDRALMDWTGPHYKKLARRQFESGAGAMGS